jgi:hypothetical protein
MAIFIVISVIPRLGFSKTCGNCKSAQRKPQRHDSFAPMFRMALRFLLRFLVLTVVVPISIGAALGYAKGWPANWKVANWDSSGLLPEAVAVKPATVMILSTRTGRWKGIFAEHMSIVLKPEGANKWTRYDVVGWGSPVRKDDYAADALWYGNAPRVIYRRDGTEAAKIIPDIEASIARYPYQKRGTYVVWPGPNSNTFVSWVVRNTPGLDAELPPVAVGKDWLGSGFATGVAPSKTGWTFSFGGFAGGTLAWEEGLELHLLGSTIGVDPNDVAIKLPALDKLSLLSVMD